MMKLLLATLTPVRAPTINELFFMA